jgi:hypothetical protein
MEEFKTITLKEGRELVNQVGVLILPEWDITDVVAFNVILKSQHPS